jgi:hypothetical protein
MSIEISALSLTPPGTVSPNDSRMRRTRLLESIQASTGSWRRCVTCSSEEIACRALLRDAAGSALGTLSRLIVAW